MPSMNDDASFVMSTSQQVEVHKLLHRSDLTTSSSQEEATALSIKEAERRDKNAIVLDSDSIVPGTSSGAGGLEEEGSRAVQQVLPHLPLTSEALINAEDGAAVSRGETPAKKLRRVCGHDSNCGMEQVTVLEQREEKRKTDDSVDEFFISATQVTALWGMGSDQCEVLQIEGEGEKLTPQDSEWEVVTGSLVSMPLCDQPVEENHFADDSCHSTSVVINLMKDSSLANHNSTSPTTYGNDECRMRETAQVSIGRGVREGDGESDHELTVLEERCTERMQDIKPGGEVGVTKEFVCISYGPSGKTGEPLQTGELSCTAEQGEYVREVSIINDGNNDKEGETVDIHKEEMDCEKRVELYAEKDSDFQTTSSEVVAISPSRQVSWLPCNMPPTRDKGALQTATTNTPVVILDHVCEVITPKTARDFSDPDTKTSLAAPILPRSKDAGGSEETCDKFRIIVPAHNETTTHFPIPEQYNAKCSQAHTQMSQSSMANSSLSCSPIALDISLPVNKIPHHTVSSDTSLLTTMLTPITSTDDFTQRRRKLLTKINAYWQRKHMESPVSSDILCHSTALHDPLVHISSHTPPGARPRKPC